MKNSIIKFIKEVIKEQISTPFIIFLLGISLTLGLLLIKTQWE